MAAPATAHLILTVLQRYVTDSLALHALVADLELELARPEVDQATKALFQRLASELRGDHVHAAPVLPSRGYWKNKGHRSW